MRREGALYSRLRRARTRDGVTLAGEPRPSRRSANIAAVVARLGVAGRMLDSPFGETICAAIPDGDVYLLLAIEGFHERISVAGGDPWFAGCAGVMVPNISDVAAPVGGRPDRRGRVQNLGPQAMPMREPGC